MLRFRQHRHTTVGRALLLVALLALFGGNLLEAGHTHAPHEVTADCLLYHASANGVCGSIHTVMPDYGSAVATATSPVAPALRAIFVRPPPRGPPVHS